jgi:hypothetical protein
MRIFKKILQCRKQIKKKQSKTRNLPIHIKTLVGNICLYVVISTFKAQSATFPIPPQMTIYKKWPFNEHM